MISASIFRSGIQIIIEIIMYWWWPRQRVADGMISAACRETTRVDVAVCGIGVVAVQRSAANHIKKLRRAEVCGRAEMPRALGSDSAVDVSASDLQVEKVVEPPRNDVHVAIDCEPRVILCGCALVAVVSHCVAVVEKVVDNGCSRIPGFGFITAFVIMAQFALKLVAYRRKTEDTRLKKH